MLVSETEPGTRYKVLFVRPSSQQSLMQRSLRLQPVFCLSKFGIINKIIAFFIIVPTNNLRDFLLKILIPFLFLALRGLGISSHYGGGASAQLFALFLAIVLLLFSFALVRGLPDFRSLFGLIDLILGLRGLLVSLIISKIETHLQETFLFRTQLM